MQGGLMDRSGPMFKPITQYERTRILGYMCSLFFSFTFPAIFIKPSLFTPSACNYRHNTPVPSFLICSVNPTDFLLVYDYYNYYLTPHTPRTIINDPESVT